MLPAACTAQVTILNADNGVLSYQTDRSTFSGEAAGGIHHYCFLSLCPVLAVALMQAQHASYQSGQVLNLAGDQLDPTISAKKPRTDVSFLAPC